MQRAHNDCNADGRLEEPLSAFSVFMRRLVSAGRERPGQMIKVHRARMMKKMKVRFIAELARLKGWRVDGDSERKHSAVHFGPKAGSNLLIRTLGLSFPYLKEVRSLTSLVEDHADHVLATLRTQEEAIHWARSQGHTPHAARVRHLNNKNKPDHWRKV